MTDVTIKLLKLLYKYAAVQQKANTAFARGLEDIVNEAVEESRQEEASAPEDVPEEPEETPAKQEKAVKGLTKDQLREMLGDLLESGNPSPELVKERKKRAKKILLFITGGKDLKVRDLKTEQIEELLKRVKEDIDSEGADAPGEEEEEI